MSRRRPAVDMGARNEELVREFRLQLLIDRVCDLIEALGRIDAELSERLA